MTATMDRVYTYGMTEKISCTLTRMARNVFVQHRFCVFFLYQTNSKTVTYWKVIICWWRVCCHWKSYQWAKINPSIAYCSAKRQAKKPTILKQWKPSTYNKNQDSTSAAVTAVGGCKWSKGGLKYINTGGSKWSSSTRSSSKQQCEAHKETVKSVLHIQITRNWIKDQKFSNHSLAEKILNSFWNRWTMTYNHLFVLHLD